MLLQEKVHKPDLNLEKKTNYNLTLIDIIRNSIVICRKAKVQ